MSNREDKNLIILTFTKFNTARQHLEFCLAKKSANISTGNLDSACESEWSIERKVKIKTGF